MPRRILYTFLLSTIFLCFLSCSSPETLNDIEKKWLDDNKEISVAVFPYYAPYQFINENNQIDGILIDHLNAIEAKIGYKFQRILYTNWEKLLKDARSGEIDIILEIQQTSNRDNYLRFYAQLFESKHTIVTRDDVSYGSKLKDFEGKVVTVPKGYAIDEILKENEKNITIVTEIDDLACLKAVSEGKYDAYIGPKAVTNFLIKTENLNNLKIISETQYSYAPSLAVQKNNVILNQIITKATNSITDNEKEIIFENWLYQEIVPFYKKISFWITLTIVILSLTIVIILLNRYLKYLIKEKTAELVIAKEHAEESNRLKTAFIHNISHEVRTPMNGIIGFSELLNDPNLSREQQTEYTEIIMSSSNQLIRIIDDIIEISRLQTNQVKVNPTETNISELISDITSRFEKAAKEKNITLQLTNDLTNDQSTILIDKNKVDKILHNLIDNAIKFTNEGKIEISCHPENEKLKIPIQDTGIGINNKDQELIFKNFSQSEKEVTKSYDGLGLGLSIAKKNAELLGGNISFTSKIDEGSTFTLTIPYFPIIDPNKANKNLSSESTSNEPIKQVILIAEDGEVNYLFLKTVLMKMQGYKFVIHRAENGKKAVDLCNENPEIDLVLMDIKMPIMDGYSATKKIKKMRPDLPVIAQTAYSTAEDIQRALEAGCDDFVAKPVDRKILKPMLKKYFSVFSK
ncbi:transporter substrate-binding domain-containing protein [Aquimarina sp. MMG016]|uniref:response regulator n=1 Tax=Aquimarina sp. MMG016 TaxID=2822690 RepID=UPI001B3A049B|nr:transporter substrate-binding domain-containing protein [Aquimarina sp. MMG016]MBQ4822759.1 transporter substrate-binding domain-containing protein [Aquimarina sp. MMG016]